MSSFDQEPKDLGAFMQDSGLIGPDGTVNKEELIMSFRHLPLRHLDDGPLEPFDPDKHAAGDEPSQQSLPPSGE